MRRRVGGAERRIPPWVPVLDGLDEIGGLQQRLFFTTLKCADAIQFEFDKADLKVIK
jgi:hypothetical protein